MDIAGSGSKIAQVTSTLHHAEGSGSHPAKRNIARRSGEGAAGSATSALDTVAKRCAGRRAVVAEQILPSGPLIALGIGGGRGAKARPRQGEARRLRLIDVAGG